MSEQTDVQNPLLKYADEIGWEFVPTGEALELRGGDKGLYFTGILEAQLARLNPGVLDEERSAEIVRQLNLLKPSIEGNKDARSWLRGERSVYVPDAKRELNIKLIDFDRLDNNVFQVTEEWTQRGPVFKNRADVVFLINGLPVALAELKAAGKPDGLAKAVDQIRRYERETPEMLVCKQVFEVTQLFDFFYGVTWNTARKNLFNWRDEVKGDYEHKVKAFFDRARVLRMLHEQIVFLTKDDSQLSKVILRQHQTRAVAKVVERVADPVKRRGLIWHTQGSGKTLTMISVAAKLLRETPGGEKPTVVMLVDRNELEGQLSKNIAAYGLKTFETAKSKRHLQDLLKSDYRGLIVTMIHKFDDIPANLNTRTGIVVLVDEAHRTTGGNLGNYLLAALPNATYIGFTGTPIDKLHKGEGTFKVFGCDDGSGYLDKYPIVESIEDGTTVKLNYALAPSELRVDKDVLEKDFLRLAESEGVCDIEELNAILDRAVELKEMMKSPRRVEMIAKFAAQHFRENVEPMGFKAFLVGVDREACALYKKALDKYLPPESSRVVFSGSANDSALLKEFHLTADEEKKVRKEFIQKGTQPKILVVTEKLLTGFDAPILYAMYLDKPMRDHVLLQTIARVNRPYEDDDGLVKPFGFVLDFVGVFERLQSALAFDSDVVASVIQNMDVLRDLFATIIQKQMKKYLPLAKATGDKGKEAAVEFFTDKSEREEFFKLFRNLQNLYEIISPDAFLRPFMDDYLALSELFALIRGTDSLYVDRELTNKTRELLRTRTETGRIQLPGAVHSLGAKELAALKTSGNSATIKILNLSKILREKVETDGGAQLFLISIGERADALKQAYDERQISTQKALDEFLKLSQETVDADKERAQLGIDENTFAIYTALKLVVEDVKPEHGKAINALFEALPDFQWNENQKAKLRTELYKVLRPLVGPQRMIALANTLLKLQRV